MSAKTRQSENVSISTIAKITIGFGFSFVAGYLVSRIISKQNNKKFEGNNDNVLKCGKYQRFITGHDENGKAIVIKKDYIPNRKKPKNRNISVFNIWRCTNHINANKDLCNDLTLCDNDKNLIPLEPSLNGSNFRIIEFAPESTIKDFYKTNNDKIESAWSDFGVNNKKVFGGKGAKHPFMHKTDSIDYAVILHGQIFMVLDDSEILLKAGDTIVQRGTNHSWKNCFDEICVICFILIHS